MFKRISYQFLTIITCFVLLGCTSHTTTTESKKRAAWIDNPYKLYPKEMYIVGIGSGATREAAKNNAIGNVSTVFQSKVDVERRLIEKYKEIGDEKETELTQSIKMLTSTDVRSTQELKNIKIAESYYDKKEGIYYVLAYLDRSETSLIYRAEIEENNDAILKYYNKFKESRDKFTKYSYINKACEIIAINEALIKQLNVIKGGAAEFIQEISSAELINERQNLLKTIIVNIEVNEESEPKLKDYLQEMVAKFGFQIGNENPCLTIKGTFNIEDIDLKRGDKMKFVRWKLTIDLIDNINGVQMSTFSEQGREGHVTYSEARERAMRVVREKILTNFYQKIDKYLSHT